MSKEISIFRDFLKQTFASEKSLTANQIGQLVDSYDYQTSKGGQSGEEAFAALYEHSGRSSVSTKLGEMKALNAIASDDDERAEKLLARLQKTLLCKLPASEEKVCVEKFHAIAKSHGADKSADIIAEAANDWLKLHSAKASANDENGVFVHHGKPPTTRLPKGSEKLPAYIQYSPAGKAIREGLEELNNTQTFENNGRVIMEREVANWNRLVKGASIEITDKNGNVVAGIDDNDRARMATKIPDALQNKKEMTSAFGSSGFAQKLKNGLVFDRCEC